MIGLVPISPYTEQLRILRGIDQRRQASIATYANQQASPKTYGQAITPESVRITPSGKDLERKLRDDFKGPARGNTTSDSYCTGSGGYGTLVKSLNDDNRMVNDDPRDQDRPSSLDDDDRSRSKYFSHCATTAPLTNDSAIL
jgi:hypothetical protein